MLHLQHSIEFTNYIKKLIFQFAYNVNYSTLVEPILDRMTLTEGDISRLHEILAELYKDVHGEYVEALYFRGNARFDIGEDPDVVSTDIMIEFEKLGIGNRDLVSPAYSKLAIICDTSTTPVANMQVLAIQAKMLDKQYVSFCNLNSNGEAYIPNELISFNAAFKKR